MAIAAAVLAGIAFLLQRAHRRGAKSVALLSLAVVAAALCSPAPTPSAPSPERIETISSQPERTEMISSQVVGGETAALTYFTPTSTEEAMSGCDKLRQENPNLSSYTVRWRETDNGSWRSLDYNRNDSAISYCHDEESVIRCNAVLVDLPPPAKRLTNADGRTETETLSADAEPVLTKIIDCGVTTEASR